ncbi:SNF2 family N-terminal domain-containing protein [Kaistia soli DSM 19436]|uniref:SNF2 family N-terminal domain-containing protein n=1 Tax=Kaistia soli DSM 19436 TaxID=1122133 RepID=A0A1M4VEG1_9HYPH|nr:DEAD/DEAH box helicase [Kaistia soli]SHE67315.1 SNF2 family N-terminal domain-containing protein [Kaistia soli DSM 19436]
MDLTLTFEAARPLGLIRHEPGRWVIERCEPHVAIRLKQIFPRIPKQAVAPFALPDDPLTCADIEWFASRYAFEIAGPDLGALREGKDLFHRNSAELDRILLPDWQPLAGGAGLRDGQNGRAYQHQAVEVVMRRGALLLGDVGGLGKTYVGGLLAVRPGVLPVAIVVEAHLQAQWKEKLEAFTTLRVHCIKTTNPLKEKLPDADVYIWRYSQLAGWVSVFAEGLFRTVIFDEIQKLRTGTSSAMGASAKVLAEKASYRLGLTGSPIYGYGIEIFAVLQFIDANVLGDYYDFQREWTKDGKHLSEPKALGTFLREQHVYLRRTKEDVGQQMPAVNRVIQTVEHHQADLDAVEAIVRALATQVTFGSFTERGEAARELDWRLRHATGLAKARSVAAYARLLLENDQPVLLCGWHRDVYDIWLKELHEFRPFLYTGSESPAQKEAAKRAALGGDTDLLIISLRSGAGLDGLQHRFSDVVFGELDWSPGVHQQLVWRLDREGQTRPVTAHYLVSDDGSDPVVISRLGIKGSEARGVNDPHLGVESVPSDTSNIKALARRYLTKAQLAAGVAEPIAPALRPSPSLFDGMEATP